MRTLSAIYKIIRPINFFITLFSVIVAGIIAVGKNVFTEAIIYSALAEALAVAAGNIINDYFDIAIDKINKPERVLPSGQMSKNSALILYFMLLILSSYISFLISNLIFILLVFTHLLLFLYSFRLKKIILLGNFIVAALVGSAFILGAAAAGNISGGIIPFVFAFLINFGRELLKDMEDIKGDSAKNVISFPNKYGFKTSKQIILFIISILIVFIFYPYLTGIYNLIYLLIAICFVIPLLIYFLIELFKNDSITNLNKLSAILKLSMILGLTAIYFGV